MFEMRKVVRFVGTPEQEAIWQAIKEDECHVLVEALAGTGKTTTNVEGLKKMLGEIAKGKRFGFCAFGRANGQELKQRVPRGVWAGTTHGLGYGILRANLESVELDTDKTWDIITELREEFLEGKWWKKGERPNLRKLTSMLKQQGFRPPTELQPVHKAIMDELCLKYDITWPGDRDVFYEYANEVLKACRLRTHIVDYDDQIWLPYVLDLEGDRFDVLMVDEAQDLNPVQHHLTMQSGERLIVIGDRHQSIYGFRGADPDSMQKYEAKLKATKRGLKVLPLSVSWRCPESVIRAAQKLVPAIKAKPEAVGGVVMCCDYQEMYEEIQPGDMVLCRTNMPLVRLLYRLWADSRPAFIQGKDVSDGMLRMIEKYEDYAHENPSLAGLNRWIDVFERTEREKLEARKGSSASIAHLEDKCDCLRVMVDYTESRAGIEGLKRHMEALFQEDGNPEKQIRLSSVHRAKGLEADRVFVLEPGLMPHYLCRLDWEMEQEKNIAYVAITRAKQALYFVGGLPPLLAEAGFHDNFGDEEQADVPGRYRPREKELNAVDSMLGEALEKSAELLGEIEEEYEEDEGMETDFWGDPVNPHENVEEIMPRDFLAKFHDVCDPPFCFRCGERSAYCRCPGDRMTKQEWLREWARRDREGK